MFFFLAVNIAIAQDLQYVKTIVDTLCSQQFFGRGYVKNGHGKAAEFIFLKMQDIGLKPVFNGEYSQKYSIPVNTFPGEMELLIDNKRLVPGKDFIIAPESGWLKGSFNVKVLNNEIISNKKLLKKRINNLLSNDILVIDVLDNSETAAKIISQLTQHAPGKAAGVILLSENKLTHSVGTYMLPFCSIIMHRNAWNSGAKVISVNISQQFDNSCETSNVSGMIVGTLYPDSFIVVSAHYDHLGGMGNVVYFPGANDNASGVATLLDLAKHFQNNPLPYSIVFVAFGAEEIGLLGSKYFSENPPFDLKKVKFLLNLDIMGTGEEGFGVVNASVFNEEYNLLTKLNDEHKYLPKFKPRGKAANSDHYWFTEKGVHSFFIYTMGGAAHYHDVYDTSASLTFSNYENVFKLLRDFLTELSGNTK